MFWNARGQSSTQTSGDGMTRRSDGVRLHQSKRVGSTLRLTGIFLTSYAVTLVRLTQTQLSNAGLEWLWRNFVSILNNIYIYWRFLTVKSTTLVFNCTFYRQLKSCLQLEWKLYTCQQMSRMGISRKVLMAPLSRSSTYQIVKKKSIIVLRENVHRPAPFIFSNRVEEFVANPAKKRSNRT